MAACFACLMPRRGPSLTCRTVTRGQVTSKAAHIDGRSGSIALVRIGECTNYPSIQF